MGKKLLECSECGEKIHRKEKSAQVEVYDSPWDTEPTILTVHIDNEDQYGRTCYDKLTDTGWADFRYFECPVCERMVIRQCPRNGWRSYVKIMDGEEICAACYQKEHLENGDDINTYAMGKIPGDFYESEDLEKYHWEKVESAFIRSPDSAGQYCRKAVALSKAGKKVLTDYDSMAIGGSEGYVTLYSK